MMSSWSACWPAGTADAPPTAVANRMPPRVGSARAAALDQVEHHPRRISYVEPIGAVWSDRHENAPLGLEMPQGRLAVGDVERRDHPIVSRGGITHEVQPQGPARELDPSLGAVRDAAAERSLVERRGRVRVGDVECELVVRAERGFGSRAHCVAPGRTLKRAYMPPVKWPGM